MSKHIQWSNHFNLLLKKDMIIAVLQMLNWCPPNLFLVCSSRQVIRKALFKGLALKVASLHIGSYLR